MKTIETVNIWDNGIVQEAVVLNSYANNVTLNVSATFCYALYSVNLDTNLLNILAQGQLIMTGDAYTQWQTDNYAWDWVAEQLNLTITGDYVPPVPPEPTPEPTPIVEETIA